MRKDSGKTWEGNLVSSGIYRLTKENFIQKVGEEFGSKGEVRPRFKLRTISGKTQGEVW